MPKRACESLVQRPGQTEGWTDWGYLQDTAEGQQFVSLNYGLESHLDQPTAFYHLAAAGLCEVKGKHLSGQMVADDPTPLTLDPDSPVIEVAHEPPPPVPSPVDASGRDSIAATVFFVLVLLAALAAFISDGITRKNDTTPKPEYPDIFNANAQEDKTHD